MNDDDEVCEICGQGGEVMEAKVLTPLGWLTISIHIVCENSRVAQQYQRYQKARWN